MKLQLCGAVVGAQAPTLPVFVFVTSGFDQGKYGQQDIKNAGSYQHLVDGRGPSYGSEPFSATVEDCRGEECPHSSLTEWLVQCPYVLTCCVVFLFALMLYNSFFFLFLGKQEGNGAEGKVTPKLKVRHSLKIRPGEKTGY